MEDFKQKLLELYAALEKMTPELGEELVASVYMDRLITFYSMIGFISLAALIFVTGVLLFVLNRPKVFCDGDCVTRTIGAISAILATIGLMIMLPSGVYKYKELKKMEIAPKYQAMEYLWQEMNGKKRRSCGR